jgi:hypothetical protein
MIVSAFCRRLLWKVQLGRAFEQVSMDSLFGSSPRHASADTAATYSFHTPPVTMLNVL